MIQPLNGIITTYDDDFLAKRLRFSKALLIIGLVLGTYYYFSSHPILCFISGLVALLGCYSFIQSYRLRKRFNYILNTPFPPQLWQNELLRHQPLTVSQRQLIEAGLRDFFILHLFYSIKPLAMPSQLIDKLWHAFILDTARYQDYCKHAFGKIFHHVPDYSFSDRGNNIKLFTWQIACRLQGIRPARPHGMPRLFGIDPLLMTGIAVGSATWLTYQQQMGALYQTWHANTFGSSTSSAGGDVDGDYNDSCDVGVTGDGDCSCGGSGGDGCGGGCGGGGD